ncbi:hypothetical protein [Paraburkholderia caribensis]|uniref:hypothetical protein n=1 Tax=Paraburkholderia caribensis TaxID=75105 RepID=UPI0031D7635D
MALYNVAVILWQWGAPGTLHDRSWYEEYFFNPIHGQAAYWLKQSDGDVVLSGRVFDWVVDTVADRDFSDRKKTAKIAVDAMENDHGADLTSYQSIVVVLGIADDVKSDGSSTSVNSRGAVHHAVVTRIKDPFAFVSHELGHGIVGPHSFTWNQLFQVTGENPGGYGHRHCIMSARSYGGNAEAEHNPPAPLGLQPEYQSIGPSVNGVKAKARGWIDTHDIVLTPNFNGEFEIRSRQWMGRDPTQSPQGIHVTTPDGNTYVVEFYENMDWDSGLSRPYLILTQDKGGLADFHYPGMNSGTYIDSIPLAPASLTGWRAVINDVVGILPVFYDAARHVLRVQLSANNLSGGVIGMAEAVSTVSRKAGSDRVTFQRGDRFCVTGEWPFDWMEYTQTLTVNATHPRVGPDSIATWTIDGVSLSPDQDKLTLHKTVMVPDPKQLDLTAVILVEIGYKIEQIPNGSRLTLTNRPQDDNYSLAVGVTLTTNVATGSASRTVEVTGRECLFPPEFYEAFAKCMSAYLKKKLHDSQVVVVFDPGLIHQVHPEFAGELPDWLRGLANSLDKGDHEGFELAAAALRNRLRLPNAKLNIVDRSEVGNFPRMTEDERSPPPAAVP